ncbi:MAG: hypothetical protein ACREUU_21845, partial [Gammaproteobacteria bacterium]
GRSPTLNSYENASIDAVTLNTGARKTIWRGGYFGRYLPTRGDRGHLIYLHKGVLFGVGFDPERLELEGTPAPMVEDIASDPTSGGGQFDISATGTLVYLEGSGSKSWTMVSLDAAGKTGPLLPKPAMYYSPRFSPDGRRLAFALEAENGSDIYVHDFASQVTSRLTFTQMGNIEPVWTPDGKHLVYRSLRKTSMFWVRADGGGEPQRLRESYEEIQGCSFSPDGRQLAYQERNRETGLDVMILPLDLSDPNHPRPGPPQPLVASPASERYPAFSPDGRWIAYQSDESGNVEVYVRRVPEPGGKWQISIGGGTMPMWSRKGELFYQAPDNRIMAVTYEVTEDSFRAGKPRVWSPARLLNPGFVSFDVAPDGKRFAVLQAPEAGPENKGNLHATFLLNFFDELQRRVPSAAK